MDSNQSAFWQGVRNLKRSSTDKKIAGVCGGFGEHTPMPAWLWRALFLALSFSGVPALSPTSFFGSAYPPQTSKRIEKRSKSGLSPLWVDAKVVLRSASKEPTTVLERGKGL